MDFTALISRIKLDSLLPSEYARFSRIIHEGLILFLSGLPSGAQGEILQEQLHLGADCSFAQRLGHLAKHSPVLHKLGQTLARNQKISLSLRQELQKLEWIPPSIPRAVIEAELNRELGPLASQGIVLAPQAIAEASVAVVIPFTTQTSPHKEKPPVFDRVFKLLKPGIEEKLLIELELLEKVGALLDELTQDDDIPPIGYREVFEQVGSALRKEILLEREQHQLKEAAERYVHLPQIKIPQLLPLCSPRVTAMERISGRKLDAAEIRSPGLRKRLANLVIEALIIHPTFSSAEQTLFHADPHAGNLFYTDDEQLALIDWSQADHLQLLQQQAISKIILAAYSMQQDKILSLISGLALTHDFDRTRLKKIVSNALADVMTGNSPGFSWLINLFDHAAVDAGVRFPANVMLFRKSLLTISGIVEELTKQKDFIDSALFARFLRLFAEEWPMRWMPTLSASQCTHLSNTDLLDASFAMLTAAPSCFINYWQAILSRSK